MLLTLDNLDGHGPLDYSSAIDSSEPFTIERTLNAPSTLKGLLCLAGSSPLLPIPDRRARAVVTSATASATILFTGYLTVEPVAVYAGEASSGPVFRYALSAVSDEWLLDKQAAGAPSTAGLGGTGASLLATLAQRLDGTALIYAGLIASRPLGVLEPPPVATFSAQAGALANAAYSSYRALDGTLYLNLASSVQHSFSAGDGSFSIAALRTASVRELANDVTVTGAEEPSAFITELFIGDGSTSIFPLLGEPSAPSSGHAAIVLDPFNQPSLDLQTWQLADPGSNLALSSAGLGITGGTGFDGQTTLTAWNPLELGGTVVLELSSVSLAAGSAGVLGGLYTGAPVLANCFAGFHVRQQSGQTIAVPILQGIETGTPLTLIPGHHYTLRMHLHAPELLRVKQTFYALVDSGSGPAVNSFGGGTLDSPVSLVFEARDLGASSNTPVTLLFDGTLPSSPAQASIFAVNSLTLVGSVGSFSVTRTGSCWITSVPTSGAPFTRLAGTLAEGVDCTLTSGPQGKVTFFPGRIPAPGESLLIRYRGRRRAVARVADPASLTAEAAGGSTGSARWLGHVIQPPARSQEDCEAAACAILAFSTNRADAVSGTYIAINPPGPDIWPGDTLSFTVGGSSTSFIARRITLSTQGASPEALTYRIAFANDWAEGLGLKLSESIPAGTLLPAFALDLSSDAPPALQAHVLAGLSQLTVTLAPPSALTIDAGLDPPPGGGFEVRRRDGGFGTGSGASGSADLVLRSPVRGFSIPISGQQEKFFLRTYDSSAPPLFSRCSAAVFTHLPAS